MEVKHVFVFETDFTAEVLANNALPRGEESLIEEFLDLLGEVHILELALPSHALLNEFDSFQSHV